MLLRSKLPIRVHDSSAKVIRGGVDINQLHARGVLKIILTSDMSCITFNLNPKYIVVFNPKINK